MSPGLAGLSALGSAIVATPLCACLAVRFGVVDRPGPEKVQTRPVPYLGGLAVLVAVAIPVGFARPALLLPVMLAAALGLADDVLDLPPPARLVVEIGIGALVAWLVPTSLPEPFGFLGVVAAVVVLVNAVNLIDGLDGLAASVVAVAAIGFAIVLGGPERSVAASVVGALAGFLVFNRPPARIYLGDAGSYLLGTLLAAMLAMAWDPDRPVSVGVSALLLVVVPVADLAVAVVRRFLTRRPLLTSDRGHIYDQLVDRAWSPGAAVVTMAGAQAVLVAVAVGASVLGGAAAAVVVLVVLLAVVLTILSLGFATYHPPGTRP